MMRKFAAALLATALIAGPAFAASATGNDSKAPAAEQTAKPAKPVKTAKTNHVRKHHRYVVRHRNGGKLVVQAKRHKRHGHYMAHYTGHVAKPVKTDKINKSDKY